MNDTIAQQQPAAGLARGMRIAAGFLPLRAAAEILFAYPYKLYGESRVCVVYLYDGDGQPQPDDFLADSLIPVTGMPCTCPGPPIFTDGCREHDPVYKPVAACVWDVPGQAPGVACTRFPLCECTPPADWVQ